VYGHYFKYNPTDLLVYNSFSMRVKPNSLPKTSGSITILAVSPEF